ncbi:MAG TPA: ABC transporter permease [Ktedonobacteraceae bacterium]
MQQSTYTLRVIWSCMVRDIKSLLTDRAFTLVGILTPLNAFILMSLFVLAGTQAPTAIVMQDSGPYAQRFYQSLGSTNGFKMQISSASQAESLIQAGKIVAVITIPADFDLRLQHNAPVNVGVQINNLNTDFTNDIRRSVPNAITKFYANAFPDVVTITAREHDLYPQDTNYIDYLTVSILVVGMLFGGIMHAGTSMSREWETSTMKELLFSPASRWAIVVGKMLGAFVINIASVLIVLAVLVFVIGVHPVHWGEVIAFSILGLLIFIAWGIFLGTFMRQRKQVVVFALGLSIPLFFLSGPFGPISFSAPAIQGIAQVFPVYYAIVLQQHAFHGFDLNTYGLGVNVLIVCGYALLLILLAAFALRRSTIAH